MAHTGSAKGPAIRNFTSLSHAGFVARRTDNGHHAKLAPQHVGGTVGEARGKARQGCFFRVGSKTLSRLLCASSWINRFLPALIMIMGLRFAICATFWRRRRSFDYLSTARSDEVLTALNATGVRIWGRRNTCGVRTPPHPNSN